VPSVSLTLENKADGHILCTRRAGHAGGSRTDEERTAEVYGLIDEIKVAMMTTRRPDGHLESRAMATQKQADGADLTSSPRRIDSDDEVDERESCASTSDQFPGLFFTAAPAPRIPPDSPTHRWR
jgi:hypothetical protein